MNHPDRTLLLEALLGAEARALFVLDAACDIVLHNEVARAMMAWLGSGQPITNLKQITPPDAIERLQRYVTMIFGGLAVSNRETRMVYPDHGVVWWSLDYKPLRGPDDQIIGAALWVLDITQQRAEQERRAHRVEVEEPPDVGIALIQRRGDTFHILDANDGYTQITGAPRDALRGQPYPLLHRVDDAQPALARLRDAVYRGRQAHATLRSYRGDESVFLDRVTIFPVHLDGAGVSPHLISVHRNTTSELELRAQLDFQEQIMRAAPGATLVFDLSTHVTASFGDTIALLGWSHAELRGMSARELFVQNDAACISDHLDLLRDGSRYEGVSALNTRSGEQVPLALIAQLVPGTHGAPDRLVLFCHDMRPQFELESQLMRMKHMEHVGWMAQGLVHDLNHAITLALLHLDEFSEIFGDHNPSLDLARLSLREAANLSRGVLQFASEDLREHSSLIELDRWLAQTSRAFQLIVPAGVELGTIAAPNLLVRVVTARLQQVLFNLIHNAAQALLTHKAAPHEPRRIRLGCEPAPEPGMALLHVEDNGCGMAADAVAQIFTPFYTTRPNGTGLGLPLCKLIVERWGGAISVSSTPGAGTRVSFTIPLATL